MGRNLTKSFLLRILDILRLGSGFDTRLRPPQHKATRALLQVAPHPSQTDMALKLHCTANSTTQKVIFSLLSLLFFSFHPLLGSKFIRESLTFGAPSLPPGCLDGKFRSLPCAPIPPSGAIQGKEGIKFFSEVWWSP